MAGASWRRITWHRRLGMAWDDAPTCRPELGGDTFLDILDGAIVRAPDTGYGAYEEVNGPSRDQPFNNRQCIRKRGCWKLQHAAAAGLAAAGVAGRRTAEVAPVCESSIVPAASHRR